MKYTLEETDGVLFARLEGNLMGEASSEALLKDISERAETGNVRLCAVNMSKVEYMNSNGIGIAVNIMTKMRNRDGEAVLVQPSAQVRKLLTITKLDSVFKILDSEEEVLSSVNR